MESVSRKPARLILNCHGGLGNQMFEYVAGRYFAQKLDLALEVVEPPAKRQNWHGFPRPFQLNEFCIREAVRQANPIDRLFFSGNPRLKTWHATVGNLLGAQLIVEPKSYHFTADLQRDPRKKSTYLTGYWQASGYAQALEPEVREEFRLRSPLHARNLTYAQQIQQLVCPVSLHVRIGDYAQITHPTSGGSQRVSNVLTARYYERAIDALSQSVSPFTLVVFSDEPKVARKLCQGIGQCLFIEGGDASTAHEDLHLMSLCRHHIIANSSFSWWGAWLNPSPGKLVFAPRYWGNTVDSYFPDLYPSGWTIVDNL
jgi:hypothetical protein